MSSTARTAGSRLRLLQRTAGSPASLAHKLARLLHALGGYHEGAELERLRILKAHFSYGLESVAGCPESRGRAGR